MGGIFFHNWGTLSGGPIHFLEAITLLCKGPGNLSVVVGLDCEHDDTRPGGEESDEEFKGHLDRCEFSNMMDLV